MFTHIQAVATLQAIVQALTKTQMVMYIQAPTYIQAFARASSRERSSRYRKFK
jgi:bifunctional pyridoxal-dependent enzyme with beta-cystathionase and maltose regulon repressor activities